MMRNSRGEMEEEARVLMAFTKSLLEDFCCMALRLICLLGIGQSDYKSILRLNNC